jgi:hypothetical protein
MERIELLISRLQEQFDQNADPSQLLATVQELNEELTRQAQPRPAKTLGTSKVAVMMPTGVSSNNYQYEKYAPRVEDPVKEVKETVLVDHGTVAIVQDNGQLDMVFDPMTEIPTLSHQVKKDDGLNNQESLNDKLKQGKTEILEFLKETPVKDLRKAIGINDRFLFINDLFRGDEAMYERSIKTINGFNIYPEAEYWINRELKVKIGWDNENRTVQQFDHLVKRRFS